MFLITFLTQLVFGALIIGALYQATPRSYSEVQKQEAERAFEELVDTLGNTKKEDAVAPIDDFAHRTGAQVVFYQGDGIWEERTLYPLDSVYAINTYSKLREIREKYADDYKYSGIGIFHFANARKSYSLEYIIYADRTNPMTASITKTLPFLLVIVLIVSLLCAYIYTILFAKPVKQLSDVSNAMARMDFSRKCNPKRLDEIGDLGRDLDSMAETLDEKIRDLQHKNEELNKEVTRRVELESQKDMFFAAASHELKTPVTVLEGQIRGMLDGVGPYSDRDEYLARSLGTVKRMESLINEILTASKMQSGREITTSRTDMAQLLEEKMEECEELFSARGIKMELQIENDLIFEGNKDLTSIAIGAFLSNAAFYSEGGATVFVDAENVEDKLVRVTIRNTDAHIEEAELAHLFEPFYRTDRSRSRRSGGSGLGLYLARLIMEKQGGSCRLENDGKDVLATIEIPHAPKGTVSNKKPL